MDAAITSKPPVVSDAVHLVCDITCSNNHPMKILTSWPFIGLTQHIMANGLTDLVASRNTSEGRAQIKFE